MGERLTVGALAHRIGIRPSAIRFYERKGLIVSARLANGYRAYGRGAIGTLRFINRAKALGFSLEAIREILEVRRSGSKPCSCVTAMIQRKLAGINRRIAELTALRRQLVALTKSPPRQLRTDSICPVIDGDQVQNMR